MNLIVTDKCTNSCPYCFAADEMNKTKQRNILEKEDIDLFCDFLAKDGCKLSVNIIGGEPFIYPHIEYLIEKLCSSENIKDLVIFTGGVVDSSIIKAMSKYRSKISLLFNLNEERTYRNPKHHQIVIDNIACSIDNGIKMGIGYNIFKIDFNGKEIIKYCKQFGVRDLRFAVASPIYNATNSIVVKPSNYNDLAPKVYSFLKMCHKKEINAHLDCTIPYCFFNNTQLGNIAKMHPQIISRMGKCGIPIDINFDLSVFRCFSFSNYKSTHINDFNSIDEISTFYNKEIDQHLKIPTVFPECQKCEYNNRCNGGCLSNNSDFLKSVSNEKQLLELHNLVLKNNFQKAETFINSLNSSNASIKLLEMYLYYNKGDFKKAIISGREAINQSKSSDLTTEVVKFIEQLNTKR